MVSTLPIVYPLSSLIGIGSSCINANMFDFLYVSTFKLYCADLIGDIFTCLYCVISYVCYIYDVYNN
jgi:hypothetical protein